MSAIIFHNPKCSKSQATLALLRSRGVEPKIIEYLLETPTAETLKDILKMLGMQPRELIRNKEAAYRDNALDDPTLSDAALIHAMVEHPILIERPIVICGTRAAIGRPPQNVLKIIPQ